MAWISKSLVIHEVLGNKNTKNFRTLYIMRSRATAMRGVSTYLVSQEHHPSKGQIGNRQLHEPWPWPSSAPSGPPSPCRHKGLSTSGMSSQLRASLHGMTEMGIIESTWYLEGRTGKPAFVKLGETM